MDHHIWADGSREKWPGHWSCVKLGIAAGDYVTARVDDLVEKDPVYKNKVKRIIDKHNLRDVSGMQTTLKNPQVLSEFQKAYFETRTESGCGSSSSPRAAALVLGTVHVEAVSEALRELDDLLIR